MSKIIRKSKTFHHFISCIFAYLLTILPDEDYTKLMLTEGATTIVDENVNFEMKLPDWADENKIKM